MSLLISGLKRKYSGASKDDKITYVKLVTQKYQLTSKEILELLSII